MPALRGHNYLEPGPATNWETRARAQLRSGLQPPEARQPEARADPRLANEAGEPQEGDNSNALLAVLSRPSQCVSGAREGREGSIAILAFPGGERRESPVKRIPLSLKSSSWLNIQYWTELGQCPAHGKKKYKAVFNDENWHERRWKRFRLVSMAREWLKREEVGK